MPDANLTQHELRKVAVLAECDPRSVARYLRGQPVKALTRERIGRALTELRAIRAAGRAL